MPTVSPRSPPPIPPDLPMSDARMDAPDAPSAPAVVLPLLRWCAPRPAVSRAVYASLFVSVLTVVSASFAVSVFSHPLAYVLLAVFAVLWVTATLGSYMWNVDSPASHTRSSLTAEFPGSLVGGCVLLLVWSRWLLLPALLASFVAALFVSPVFALVEAMALLLFASASRMLRA